MNFTRCLYILLGILAGFWILTWWIDSNWTSGLNVAIKPKRGSNSGSSRRNGAGSQFLILKSDDIIYKNTHDVASTPSRKSSGLKLFGKRVDQNVHDVTSTTSSTTTSGSTGIKSADSELFAIDEIVHDVTTTSSSTSSSISSSPKKIGGSGLSATDISFHDVTTTTLSTNGGSHRKVVGSKLSAINDGERLDKTSHGVTSTTKSASSTNSSTDNRKVEGPKWSAIYDDESVYQTVHAIHNRFYKTDEKDNCKQRIPGAYIVGVAKSGTRELADFMHMHPQIVIRTLRPKNKSQYQLPADIFKGGNVAEKVRKMLPCTFSNQIGLVKADRFFFMDDIAQKLKKINPYMKIIVILREPISRLISHFRYKYYLAHRKREKGEFSKIIEKEPNINKMAVNKNGNIKYSKQMKMSIYESGLEIYLKYFPRNQILIIDGNNLKLDPVGVFKNVTSFLGLPSFPVEKHFVLNDEKGFYCIRNGKVINTMNCYGENRGMKKTQELTPSVKQKLIDLFSVKNEQFFTLAGQRFDWTYQE